MSYSIYDALFSPKPSLDRVLEGVPLFLGNEDAREAETLTKQGITHVLCLQTDLERASYRANVATLPPGVTELWINLVDTPGAGPMLLDIIPRCIAFIEEALAGGDGAAVLVHCAMGKSRSASVVLAWLMYRHRSAPEPWDCDMALTHLKKARPAVCPNTGFWLRLIDDVPRVIRGMK